VSTSLNHNMNLIVNRSLLSILVLSLLLAGHNVKAQEEVPVLTFDEYFELVKQHHPIARQAQLQNQYGEAYVAKAWGGFDPKFEVDLDQKYFDDKTYYQNLNNSFKVPTWFGIEVKGGFEQNAGQFLNPESKTPSNGLWYAGVSVPLGEGLFIDQRRADLKQARLYAQSTDAERQLMINQLLLDAGAGYWQWFFAYHQVQVFEEAVVLAETRYQGVVQEVLAGDEPAIDSIEAGIQVQNRKLDLQQSELDFANASAQLGVFLWKDGLVPLELAENTVPISTDEIILGRKDIELRGDIDSLISSHPAMLQSQIKIDQLEVDRRLRLEQLKPDLNLNYNALNQAVNGDPLAQYSINNYKWGLSFSMPLLLQKERAELRLNNLKLQDADYSLTLKQQTLVFKAIAALNQWETTVQQFELYTKTTDDYLTLLSGEREKFSIGESSVFLVNSRESSYIKARVKLLELQVKNQQARLKWLHSLNIIGQ
jgi:outer membrane protein TolC